MPLIEPDMCDFLKQAVMLEKVFLHGEITLFGSFILKL